LKSEFLSVQYQSLDRLAIQKVIRKDMIFKAKILTSAAVDARMAGVKIPAMTSAGSGNHGFTAMLPIQAISDFIETDKFKIMKAIGFSHIITAYIKAHTGRLSALYCVILLTGNHSYADRWYHWFFSGANHEKHWVTCDQRDD
jgi:L-cysteine desulfidase